MKFSRTSHIHKHLLVCNSEFSCSIFVCLFVLPSKRIGNLKKKKIYVVFYHLFLYIYPGNCIRQPTYSWLIWRSHHCLLSFGMRFIFYYMSIRSSITKNDVEVILYILHCIVNKLGINVQKKGKFWPFRNKKWSILVGHFM